MEHQQKPKTRLWPGRILKGLVSLFLLFDAVMKIIEHQKYVEGTEQLGLPVSSVQPLGIYLLIATVLYNIPGTILLGGLLLTAYLGGAVAITFAANAGGHPYVFPVVFAVMIWLAEYLQNENFRIYLPITK